LKHLPEEKFEIFVEEIEYPLQVGGKPATLGLLFRITVPE
jgi:hypothetical protein